jgi:hypothetical protein
MHHQRFHQSSRAQESLRGASIDVLLPNFFAETSLNVPISPFATATNSVANSSLHSLDQTVWNSCSY